MNNKFMQQNKSPKVSIITPSFNQGHFIEETILSVLNQSYQNIEFIIIDGGSSDNTLEAIKKYDDAIDYWISEPDNGQTHAINKGFKKATGEIIGWLNSDDMLDENAIKNIVKAFLQFPETDFIFGQNRTLKENGEITIYYPPNFPNLKLEHFGSFPYSQPSCYYKKEVLNKTGYLDESFHYTMDLDFFLRIALNGSMKYIDKPVGLFREQKDAKTYHYNDDWERERNKVISKFIRTFNYSKGKFLLRQFHIYIEENASYHYTVKLNEKDLIRVIAIFVRDSIQFNFHAHHYQKAYFLLKKFKTLLPNFYNKEMDFYLNRSYFYRYKLFYLTTRPLAVFKAKFNLLRNV